jgi:hypothetical protein
MNDTQTKAEETLLCSTVDDPTGSAHYLVHLHVDRILRNKDGPENSLTNCESLEPVLYGQTMFLPNTDTLNTSTDISKQVAYTSQLTKDLSRDTKLAGNSDQGAENPGLVVLADMIREIPKENLGGMLSSHAGLNYLSRMLSFRTVGKMSCDLNSTSSVILHAVSGEYMAQAFKSHRVHTLDELAKDRAKWEAEEYNTDTAE